MQKLMSRRCAQQKYELQMCSTKIRVATLDTHVAATGLLRFRVAMVAYVQPAVHMYIMSNPNTGGVSKGAMRKTSVKRNYLCYLDLGQCG